MQRINKYDNLKGIGIFLIVLGHLLFVNDFFSIKFIHNFIYIIHLPLFFFVAGYFSKIDPKEPIKSFKRLIIPFIIFNIIFKIYSILIGMPNDEPLFLRPTFALWFLSVLFMMKMVLPVYDRIKYPIIISIVIALLLGFADITSYLGFTRFVAFTPIFLIGFYFNQIKAKVEQNYKTIVKLYTNKYFMVILTCLVIISCSIVSLTFSFKVILLTAHYDVFSDIFKRLIVLILSILSVLIFNYFVSNRESIFTKFGRNSFPVYILHVYFIVLIQKVYMIYTPIHSGILFLIFALISTFVIVFILSRDIIKNYFNKLIDFTFNLVVKDSDI